MLTDASLQLNGVFLIGRVPSILERKDCGAGDMVFPMVRFLFDYVTECTKKLKEDLSACDI